MRVLHWSSVSVLALVICPNVAASQAGDVLEVSLPIEPSPVYAEGRVHLAYELQITNLSLSEATLTEVVATAEHGDTLCALSGRELATRIRVIGSRPAPPNDEGVKIPSGIRAMLFMWLSVEHGAVPSSIVHHISVTRLSPQGDTLRHAFETEPLGLGPEPVVIGPPLKGGDWWVINLEGRRQNNTGHRRAGQMSIEGRAPIAQRFARDFTRIVEGVQVAEDGEGNARSYAWGQDVLAVADGIVAALNDTTTENAPWFAPSSSPPVPRGGIKGICGNYVVLDIGSERYATYCHMQPHEMKVHVGERVHAGDVLGLVGNSGSSSGPHLHFQITDRPGLMAGEGLPYVIDRFEVVGRRAGGEGVLEVLTGQPREREMPMENMVLRFRER